MTIADLLIKIGVRGGDQTLKSLSGIKGSLGEVKESSLAAKAAIVGAVVGLERLTGWASQAGMDLYKFSATTGLSTDMLQKWQYAGMKFDVSGQEVEGTIRGIQSAMTDMQLTGNAPSGLGLLADYVGFDVKRANDTYYVMQKLQELAKKAPIPVGNQVLKSFGLSDNMIQMMRLVNKELGQLGNRGLNPVQIKNLKDINVAWKEFWFDLQSIGKKLEANEGMGVLDELSGAFRFIRDAAADVDALTQEFGGLRAVVVAVGIAIGLAFAPLTTIVTGLIMALGELQKYREGKESIFTKGILSDSIKGLADMVSGSDDSGISKANDKASANYMNSQAHMQRVPGSTAATGTPGDQENRPGLGPQVTQNVTFNVNGAHDPRATADEVQKKITQTHRQLAAQVGGY